MKAEILRHRPGLQVKAEKKGAKGLLTVSVLPKRVIFSCAQSAVRKADLSPLLDALGKPASTTGADSHTTPAAPLHGKGVKKKKSGAAKADECAMLASMMAGTATKRPKKKTPRK